MWEHYVIPSIAHQNSAKFEKFFEQAEIAWTSGQYSDVTYESLKTRRDEYRRRMEKIVVMESVFASWKRTSLKVSTPRWKIASEAVSLFLGFSALTLFIYGLFCSVTDGYELLGIFLWAASGLCAGITWWIEHLKKKEAEMEEAATRYVSDDRVY